MCTWHFAIKFEWAKWAQQSGMEIHYVICKRGGHFFKNKLFKRLLGTKNMVEVLCGTYCWTCMHEILHCNRCSLIQSCLKWNLAKLKFHGIVMQLIVYEYLDSKNNVIRGKKSIFHAKRKWKWYFWLSEPFGLPKHFLTAQKTLCSVQLIEIAQCI